MRNNHLEIVKVLAEAGTRLDNLTPKDLKLAARLLVNGLSTKTMIKAGAPLDMEVGDWYLNDQRGATALLAASMEGNLDLVASLEI